MGCCLRSYPHSGAKKTDELLQIIVKEQEEYLKPLYTRISESKDSKNMLYKSNILKIDTQLTNLSAMLSNKKDIIDSNREAMDNVKEVLNVYFDKRTMLDSDIETNAIYNKVGEFTKNTNIVQK